VAVAAGWLSYSHMVELAHRHGETGARGYVFPLTVDGVEIMASLVLSTQRRADRPGGWQPWLATAVGSVASLVSNAEVAPSDWWGAVCRRVAGAGAGDRDQDAVGAVGGGSSAER
jgi:hypothetical protein